MDFDDSTDSDGRVAAAAVPDEQQSEDSSLTHSGTSSPTIAPQNAQHRDEKLGYSSVSPSAAAAFDVADSENENDVVSAAEDVQTLVIKYALEEGKNDVQCSTPSAKEHEPCGEYLHHQLVEIEDVMQRPLTRHGLMLPMRTVRLGYGGESIEREEEHGQEEDKGEDRHVVVEEEEESYTDDFEDGALAAAAAATTTTANVIPIMSNQDSTVVVEGAEDWDAVLSSMELVDTTMMTNFCIGYASFGETSGDGAEESSYETESMVKVISPLYMNPLCAPHGVSSVKNDENEKMEKEEVVRAKQMTLTTLKCLASHILSMQYALEQEGMTIDNVLRKKQRRTSEYVEEEDSNMNPQDIICRGIHSVHVDSSYRLIAVIDVDACSVSLSDVIAFSNHPFSQEELVALIKSIIGRVSVLHNAGFVHGCLHGGNILCCTDDGRTVLTGVSGVMSNPLLPTDPSFISPRLAAAMQPFVNHLWTYETQMGKCETFPWASDPEFHRALLELYGCEDESVMRSRSSDDVYAIGIITLTCLFGFPPFHSATLKEVVNVLTSYYYDCEGSSNSNRSRSSSSISLLGTVFTSSYAVRRFKLAGYTEEFIDTALDFVEMCLSAGVGDAIDSVEMAGDLLQHSFFVNYPVVGRMVGGSELGSNEEEDMDDVDEEVSIDSIIHYLVYPIFGVLECVRKNCGTTPMITRLYRNSMFAVRLDTLRFGVNCDTYNSELFFGDAVGVLWPYIDRQVLGWCSCNNSRHPGESKGVGLLYCAQMERRGTLSDATGEGDVMSTLVTLADKKDMRFSHETRTLMYNEKCKVHFILHREELHLEYRTLIDTLTLCDLEDSQVEIFAGFRFIVLRNVRRCKIYLGPCFCCYCDEVSDCDLIAVASVHLLISGVSHVCFGYSGLTAPRCPDGQRLPKDIRITPYTVAYAGISADFAALAVPQEHASNLSMLFPGCESTSSITVDQGMKLPNTLRGGVDYPYSHALAAYGTRFVHSHDNVSDVFIFPTELSGKSIRIEHIHGGEHPVSDAMNNFSSDVTHLPSWINYTDAQEREEEHQQQQPARYPMVCVLDVVGDCVVSDCSRCTIVLLGSCELVTLRRCVSVRFILAARSIEMRDCTAVVMDALVIENVLLEDCRGVRIVPLIFRGPLRRAWRHALETGSTEEITSTQSIALQDTDEEEEEGDEENALRRGGAGVEECGCHDVQLESCPTVMFIGVGMDKTAHARSWNFAPLMQHAWKSQQFLSSMSIRRGEEVYYNETTENESLCAWAANPSPVRLHDMFNVSILRVPGTLNVRGTATAIGGKGREVNTSDQCPLVDVVLERLVVGVVHIAEEVGTLIVHKCLGPLDIIVCAARCVIMESCEHVSLQTACRSFTAKDCRACHIALHVNTPPRYIDCMDMQTSTLNITSENYEDSLHEADIALDVNRFDEPVLLSSSVTLPFTVKGTQNFSSFYSATFNTHTQLTLPETKCINSYSEALAVMQRPLSIVPPLHATCVGLEDTPFLGPLEDRVNAELVTRRSYESDIILALLFLSEEREKQLGKTDLSSGSAFITVSQKEKDLVHQMQLDIPAKLTCTTLKERHVDPFLACDKTEVGGDPPIATAATDLPIGNNEGFDGMALDSARLRSSQITPRTMLSQHLFSSSCSSSCRNRRHRRGDGFSRAVDDEDSDSSEDYDDNGKTGSQQEVVSVECTTLQGYNCGSRGTPLRGAETLAATVTAMDATAVSEAEEDEEANSDGEEDAKMDKKENLVETVAYSPMATEDGVTVEPVSGTKTSGNDNNTSNDNNNNNNNEYYSYNSSRKSDTELRGVEDIAHSDSVPRESYEPSDFIIAAHPDDEEIVQSVMQQVAASRAAFFSACHISDNYSFSCKNSTTELHKRVENALARLQNLLK